MAIPTQTEMFLVVLKLYGKGGSYTRKEMKSLVVETLGLNDDDLSLLTGSGAPIYASRVGWAISNLSSAGFLEKEGGKYSISSAGAAALSSDDPAAAISLGIKQQERLKKKIKKSPKEPQQIDAQANTSLSEGVYDQQGSTNDVGNPIELIDEGESELREQLGRDLMDKIMGIEGREGDTFFEHLVTRLLVNMGYGIGRVTSASNDGGIDGIITTDALGFDPVYIQAKRYSPGNSVQAPAIQQFAGALGSVTRGVFITTSTFTSGARQVAKDYPHATIRLIDGEELTRLMIDYDLGVATERVVKIKRLDSDFFPEA